MKGIHKLTERNTKTKKSAWCNNKKETKFLAAHDEVSRDYTDLWLPPTLALTLTQTLSVA